MISDFGFGIWDLGFGKEQGRMGPMRTKKPDAGAAWATCFRHLPKVSRTFALAIDGLPDPLRGEVCVAYLLCRVLDTVEDAPRLTSDQRRSLIDPLLDLLREADPLPISWHQAVDDLLTSRSSATDLALLKDGDLVLEAFRSCGPSARLAITRWVTEMGKGMVIWSERMGEGEGSLKTLRTMADLDRYCYYIAGTVGYLLTDLFFIRSPRIDKTLFYELQGDAEAFGLGLQKVNIVKDLADDFRRGWCFIPTDLLRGQGVRPEDFSGTDRAGAVYAAVSPVLATSADHLGRAWDYLSRIPVEEREIRLFLAYSLFFALRTLALVAEDPASLVAPAKLKISRVEVAKIVAACQLKISDPGALEAFHKKTAAPLSVFHSK